VLCCLELGLERVEMNASDARNKAALDRHSSQLIDNQMEKYLTPPNGGDQKKKVAESGKVDHVLIMDEVDGMSGNADRAGVFLFFL
jgi:replication factor C subunit 1